MTRFRDMENVILDEFRTKDELIDVFFSLFYSAVWKHLVVDKQSFWRVFDVLTLP